MTHRALRFDEGAVAFSQRWSSATRQPPEDLLPAGGPLQHSIH